MQHFRKLSSLAEDFAAMGLAGKPLDETNFFPQEIPQRQSVKENVEEGLQVQRTQKMSPGEKAKARRYRTKNKAKLARQKAVRERRPAHQIRKDRQAKLKGNRVAGPRRRFVLAQDLSSMRNEMKALAELRKLHNAQNPQKISQLEEALIRISRNAQILCRKYAVLEEIRYGHLKESAIPVMYPGLSVDWENPDAPNINQAGKDGDATDYANDSKLKGNVKAEDDMDPSDSQSWWSDMDSGDAGTDDFGGSDDDMSMDDMSMDDMGGEDDSCDTASDDLGGGDDWEGGDDDEMELDFDVDEAEDPAAADEEEGEKKDDSMGESRRIDLSFEMAKLRTEADDVLAKMKTSVLSPQQAASVVADMVQYLGGAMKAYLDLASQVMSGYQQGGYAGQGAPGEEKAAPEDNKNDNKYIGKDPPADAGVSPEIYKLN